MAKKELLINNDLVEYEIIQRSENNVQLLIDGRTFNFHKTGEHLILEDEKNRRNFQVKTFFDLEKKEMILSHLGKTITVTNPKTLNSQFSNKNSEGSLESPMPGKIFKVLVSEGDKVKNGDTLLIMEAMKMEHPIKASKDGVVNKILFKEGEQVQGNVELVILED